MRFLLLTLIALAGCQFVPGSDAAKMRTAQQAVAEQLLDGESARFRHVSISGPGKVVCGEVNAKNAFGAYTGFRPFAYRDTGEVQVFPEDISTRAGKLAAVDFPSGCLR